MGALVCVAGVALVLLVKNGLDAVASYMLLGYFLAAAVAARVRGGEPSRKVVRPLLKTQQ